MGTGEEKQLGGECGGGARLHHFPVNQAGRRRPKPGAGAVPGPGAPLPCPAPAAPPQRQAGPHPSTWPLRPAPLSPAPSVEGRRDGGMGG